MCGISLSPLLKVQEEPLHNLNFDGRCCYKPKRLTVAHPRLWTFCYLQNAVAADRQEGIFSILDDLLPFLPPPEITRGELSLFHYLAVVKLHSAMSWDVLRLTKCGWSYLRTDRRAHNSTGKSV